jgi:hypothetical protein
MASDYLFKNPDIVIVANGEELYFFKDVLCEHSENFRTRFSQNMAESKSKRIELEENANDMKLLLQVIHPVQPKMITDEHVFTIFKMAYKYKFHEIVRRCLTNLNRYNVGVITLPPHVSEIKSLLDLKYNVCFKDVKMCEVLDKIMEFPIENIVKNVEGVKDEKLLLDLPQEIMVKIMKGLINNRDKYYQCVTTIKTQIVLPYLSEQRHVLPSNQTIESLVNIFNEHKVRTSA